MKRVISKVLCMVMIVFIFIGLTNICFGITPSNVKTSEDVTEIKSMGSAIAGAGIMTAIMVIVGIIIYLIPTFVAYKRKHTYKVAIILLNIFLGWTFIGWVGTLIWAFIDNNTSKISTDKYEELAKLQKLKDSGTITDVEFEVEKNKLLK